MREETHYSHAIIEGNRHDSAFRKVDRVVDRLRAGPDAEATSVNPHQNRTVVLRRPGGRPHVDVKAVFALPLRLRVIERIEGVARVPLRAFGREGSRLTYAR